MTAAPPPPAPDREAALRWLKLATVRRLAPDVLLTAKTQRWKPDEVRRALVEAEIAARDDANGRGRLRAAGCLSPRPSTASTPPSARCPSPPSTTSRVSSGSAPEDL